MNRLKGAMSQTGCLLLCLTLSVSLSCSRAKEAGKPSKIAAPPESSREGVLWKYSQQHNAILNWKATFADKKSPLTLDFQRALVRLDGHPTTFEARLVDVFLLSQRVYLLVSVSDSPRKLNLLLEVPAEIQEQVSKLDLGSRKDLIVLADIESVDRPLSATSEPESLVAHGKCVALYDFDQHKPPETPQKP